MSAGRFAIVQTRLPGGRALFPWRTVDALEAATELAALELWAAGRGQVTARPGAVPLLELEDGSRYMADGSAGARRRLTRMERAR